MFVVFCLSGFVPLWCATDATHDRARALLAQGRIQALEKILYQANQYYSGKILEVELETRNHRLVYEIELLTENGEVIELYFDARSARLIAIEKEE